MKRPALLLAAIGLLFAVPALADEEGPVGIAFAQAEEGTWWCRDADSRRAVDCALRKCRAEANGQDCVPTRWCLPAGWSALMVTWLPEFHSTHVVCGMPGQAAAGAAQKAVCDASADITRCDLTLFIDPDGGDHPIEDTSWPGSANPK